MKKILGIKKQMMSFFAPSGKMTAATLVFVPPLSVADIRTKEKHGYNALAISDGKNTREFRVEPEVIKDLKIGDQVSLDFAAGDKVKVTGLAKGKGFAGVVKRHGFSGGPRSHGQKHSEREPGSIGGGGRAGGRVIKGMRMAGRMGGGQVSVKNLEVLAVNPDSLLIAGAVPGRRGSLLKIEAI